MLVTNRMSTTMNSTPSNTNSQQHQAGEVALVLVVVVWVLLVSLIAYRIYIAQASGSATTTREITPSPQYQAP